MNDFQQNILKEFIAPLRSLQHILETNFSETNRREAFRLIHSVKSCSLTFGLKTSVALASELENLLAERKITGRRHLQKSLLDGICLLRDSISAGQTAEAAVDFIENLRRESQNGAPQTNLFFTKMPAALFGQLSGIEKANLYSALAADQQLYSVKADFNTAQFATGFQKLRQILCETGEIIAVFPDVDKQLSERTFFQIILADRRKIKEIKKTLGAISAEIISYSALDDQSEVWREMFFLIAEHVNLLAADLNKQVDLTILVNPVSVAETVAKIVFEILLHLVRNAVDHAFSRSGKLEILLFAENDGLILTVSDNGQGVDLTQVISRAREKRLISDAGSLTDRQTLELVFASELSTAEKVSEISGRGVGLDVVKTLVAKLNGKISLQSRKGHGTKFEIFLPLEKI